MSRTLMISRRFAIAGLAGAPTLLALSAVAAAERPPTVDRLNTNEPSGTGDLSGGHVARIDVGQSLERFDRVTPGIRRYLRYTVRDGRRETVDIWQREVRFEQRDGQDVIGIDQRWDRVVSPASVRIQESTFEPRTFRPLTHINRVDRDGASTISAYRFEPDRIVGDSMVTGNSKAGFVQASSEPTFNFETDLEQFQALPWAEGYSASLMFYDPGLAAPARYTFRTAGSVSVTGPGGTALDSWIVTADYNTGSVVKTFWIAKATQLVIHEEAERDGIVYVKTLIGMEAADVRRAVV